MSWSSIVYVPTLVNTCLLGFVFMSHAQGHVDVARLAECCVFAADAFVRVHACVLLHSSKLT